MKSKLWGESISSAINSSDCYQCPHHQRRWRTCSVNPRNSEADNWHFFERHILHKGCGWPETNGRKGGTRRRVNLVEHRSDGPTQQENRALITKRDRIDWMSNLRRVRIEPSSSILKERVVENIDGLNKEINEQSPADFKGDRAQPWFPTLDLVV